jgi:hypothetical protein
MPGHAPHSRCRRGRLRPPPRVHGESDLVVLGVTFALYRSALASSSATDGEGAMTSKDLWGKALPLAGLVIGAVATLAWIGFLGYGLARLL